MNIEYVQPLTQHPGRYGTEGMKSSHLRLYVLLHGQPTEGQMTCNYSAPRSMIRTGNVANENDQIANAKRSVHADAAKAANAVGQVVF
jgi:hypothetical protein